MAGMDWKEAEAGIVDELDGLEIGSRVAEPYLGEMRFRNESIWANRSRWKFGFYFGEGDSRLWVPTRDRDGRRNDDRRVMNFCHPLGRRAFVVLAIAYVLGTAATVGFLSYLFGMLMG